MKEVAKTKEIAIEKAKTELDKIGNFTHENISDWKTSICGCGETDSIKVIRQINHQFYSCIVGYCETCGSDWMDEIDFSI